MRRREYYWSLYNTKEKNQLDSLRTDQVEAIFAAIAKKMHVDWLIWRDGFESWKAFADFPQLLMSLRKPDERNFESPPSPPGGKTVVSSRTKVAAAAAATKPKKEIDQSVVANFELDDRDSDLSLMPTNSGESRANFRFDRVLDVRITVGGKVYKNKTVNISIKGMQLQEPLPPLLPSFINVEILTRQLTIPLICTAVVSKGPHNRLKIEVNDYEPQLLDVLLNGS